MNETTRLDTVRTRFFAPLMNALQQCKSTRTCSEYSDREHLLMGVERVIQQHGSGRSWIQRSLLIFNINVAVGVFFHALRSPRRMGMVADVAGIVRKEVDRCAQASKHDALAQFPELGCFAVYASDGHAHAAASHEKPIEGKIRPVTHLYSLNLRTHSMSHIDLTQSAIGKKKEHEITTLKRVGAKRLRMGEQKGVKVIHVYDPAVIDYPQWQKWKQGSGIYIVTLEKSNSAFAPVETRAFDAADQRNAGVASDETVATSKGFLLRRIRYFDPETGRHFSFITDEFTLPPGLLAFLYKLRWNIEKTFDQIKNLFHEKKAWATSNASKVQQAAFITLAHNLTLLLEREIEETEGIKDTKILERKKKRIAQVREETELAGGLFNSLLESIGRATKRSAQFLRWLQVCLEHKTDWRCAMEQLKPLMSNYL